MASQFLLPCRWFEDKTWTREANEAASFRSIQIVNAVEPIAGADAIEKIRVLGWWVVVKKGNTSRGTRLSTARSIRCCRSGRNSSSCARIASSLLRLIRKERSYCRRIPHQDGQASRAGVAGDLLPAVDPAARGRRRGRSRRHRGARGPQVGAAHLDRHEGQGEERVPWILAEDR